MIIKIQQLEVRIEWKILLCVLLGFSLLLKLGFWQLDRAAEKRQQIADRLSRHESTAVDALMVSTASRADLEHRQLALSGEFINPQNILVSRQLYQGQYGYEVITPFLSVEDQRIVLVSRGWLEMSVRPQDNPEIEPLDGMHIIAGEIYFPSGQAFFNAGELPEQWPLVINRLNIEALQSVFSQPLYPFVLRLADKQPGLYTAHWQEKPIKPGTNISYAIQWFVMATGLLLIALFVSSNALALIRSRH